MEADYKRFIFAIIAMMFGIMLGSATVHAYSIDNVWLEWQGHEVKTLSPTTALPNTIINLKASPDFYDCFNASRYKSKVCTISIDASSLSVAPSTKSALSRIILNVRESCTRNLTIRPDGSYICKSTPFSLTTASPANPVDVRLKIDTQNKAQSFTINILQDSTSPSLLGIKTNYCNNGACYVSNSPSKFTVEFNDKTTSFDYKLVFVSAGVSPITAASSCSGSICEGLMAFPCSRDGQEFELKISSIQDITTKEDAQNPVTSSTPQKVICINKAPVIEKWLPVKGDGPANQVIKGGSATFQAKVRSFAGPAYGKVDSSNLSDANITEATCTDDPDSQDPQIYNCYWQIKDLKINNITKNRVPQPYQLNFQITDAVGNPVVRTEYLNVFNFTTLANNRSANMVAGFTNVETLPKQGLNRITLTLAANNYMPYPFYVLYDLKAEKSDSIVVNQKLNRCWYKLPSEMNYNNSGKYNLLSTNAAESRVLYPSASITERNRLNLQLRAPEGVLSQSDKFDVTCQIDFVVGDAKNIYSTPESENITFQITLRESKLGQPGEVFVNKIKHEEEMLKGGASQFLLKLRTIRSTLDGICNIMETLSSISVTASGIGTAGTGLESSGNPVTAALGGVLKNLGFNMIHRPITDLTSKVWSDDGKPGLLKQTCRQVNCRGIDDFYKNYNGGILGNMKDFTARVDNLDSGFTKTLQGDSNDNSVTNFLRREATADINTIDYKNSMVMSMMHMCVGGVIYNAGKWQDINCGYLQCLKDQSLSAGSVTVCEMGRSYKMCTQVVGELMELPFARVVKNLAGNINSIISNLPGFMLKYGMNRVCVPKDVFTVTSNSGSDIPCSKKGDWTCAGCHMLKSISNINDMKKTTKQVFQTPMKDDTICLQALCNEKDPAKCPRSFDKTEKLQQYTKYLKLNTYLINEKNRQPKGDKSSSQTGVAQNYASDAQRAAALDLDAAKRACGESCTGEQQIALEKAQLTYDLSKQETRRQISLGAPEKQVEQRSIDQIKTDASSYYTIESTAESNYANYMGSIDKLNLKKEELKSLEAQAKSKDPEDRAEAEQKLPAAQKAVEDAEAEATRSQQAYFSSNDLKNSKYDEMFTEPDTTSQLSENERLLKLSVPEGMTYDQWKTINEGAEAADLYDKCIATKNPSCGELTSEQRTAQTLRNQQALKNVGDPVRATIIANYQECMLNIECAKSPLMTQYQQNLKTMKITIDGKDAYVPTSLVTVKKDGMDSVPGSDKLFTKDGKTYTCDGSDCVEVTKMSMTEATNAAQYAADVAYTQALDMFTNVLAQYMSDKGYLDWLATSSWGEWGKDITKMSNKLFNPEQWKQNLCNDLVVNIIDNDQGAIFDVSEGDARVAASFAAEVTELENESGTYYMYVYTVYVTNPQREQSNGHKSGDGVYDFKLDMSLRNQVPGACKQDCVNGDFDMIDGTFKLKEGVDFGTGRAPKRGLLYSPMKYSKICLNFDKTYPSPTSGKTTYCRDVKEQVYDTGSPVVENPPSAGSSAGNQMATGSAGTGADSQSVSDTGALAGELS